MFLLFFILTLFALPSAFAKRVGFENIYINQESIQVAALGKKNPALLTNLVLNIYDIYVMQEKGLFKYFVVNIPHRHYERVLQEMRSEFPSAFNARSKIRTMSHSQPRQKSYVKTARLHNNKQQNEAYHVSYLGLNAKSILQTRRKFY